MSESGLIEFCSCNSVRQVHILRIRNIVLAIQRHCIELNIVVAPSPQWHHHHHHIALRSSNLESVFQLYKQ